MTPAINQAKKHALTYRIHSYSHDPAAQSYGLEAAEKLGLAAAHVFKTLVIALDSGELVVAVLPVSSSLSMKKAAKSCGAKKATMADAERVVRATGYVLGGVSPLGQKKRHRTLLDKSALALPSIFVSAGKRGVEIELQPQDLVDLLAASSVDIAA